MTEKKLSEIDRTDYQHKVQFRRPANATSTRPQVSGRLLSVRSTVDRTGRTKYSITVEHPSRFGDSNIDTYDDLPGDFTIAVGSIWRDKRNPWDMPMEEQPKLRAHLHGGPFDGVQTWLDAERWPGSGVIKTDQDGLLYVYLHKKIPEGLRRPATPHERSWGYRGLVFDGTIHMHFLQKETEQVRLSDVGQQALLRHAARRGPLDTNG